MSEAETRMTPRMAGVLGAGVAGKEAAQAVAEKDDIGGVGVQARGVGWVAEIGDGSLHVLDAVGEGEVAGGAPGAAVVEEKNVPSGAADVLERGRGCARCREIHGAG